MNTFKNNLKATLYYDMTAPDTVIWLNQLVTSSNAATRLAAWPTCDATHTFTLTLASTTDRNILEVVECTGVTANTADYISFTCTRAKEGTTAIAHGKTTTTVENRLTAAALTAIVDAIASVTATVTTANTRLDTLDANVSGLANTILGSIQSVLATNSYVPAGCVPANGAEYTRTQFPTLYDTYLAGGKFLTCTYAEFSTQVAASGNCAKFAIDTATQKFKVPMLKDGDSITQASSTAELGKSYKAGLPNITGSVYIQGLSYRSAVVSSGSLFANDSGLGNGVSSVAASNGCSTIGFNAAASSPIYGNATTVRDEQVRLRYFVVVASAQNNASVFDWSNYMAGLAGKANVAMDNLSQSGTSAITRCMTPSARSIKLTAPAYGASITMPADGFLEIAKNLQLGELLALAGRVTSVIYGTNTSCPHVYIPVQKNESVAVYPGGAGAVVDFKFIYAEGAY